MYKNVQMNPEKNPKTNTTLMLFYVFTTAPNGTKFVPRHVDAAP